jgi:hypothetical protein
VFVLSAARYDDAISWRIALYLMLELYFQQSLQNLTDMTSLAPMREKLLRILHQPELPAAEVVDLQQ